MVQRKGITVESTTSTVEQYVQYWLTEIAQPSVRETTFSSYELLQAQPIRTWLSGQVAGTGTLRYLLRLVRAALQDTCRR